LEHLYWSAAQEKEKLEGGSELDDFTPEAAADFDPSKFSLTHVYQRNELLAKIFHLCNFTSGEKGRRLVVGFVGYPNVGKSSTLNILCRQKRVAVSQTPGKTKHFQTILIGDILCLCDCPGLVFPSMIGTKEEMYCNGLLPIDQMRDPFGPISLVCDRIPRSFLEKTYGIRLPTPSIDLDEDPNRNPTPLELLQTLAFARGFMRAGHGTPDESRAARVLLKDYVNAKLLYCHPPPQFNREEWLKITIRPESFKETSTTTTTTTDSNDNENKAVEKKNSSGVRTYVEDDRAYVQQENVSARVKDRKAIKNKKDTKFTRIEYRHTPQ
jgi:large subunit GTPase 1